jgi:hypothetical protein
MIGGTMHRRHPLLAAAIAALLFSGPAAATPASAAMKSCHSVTGHPGGSATWRAHHVRLSTGFSCRRARRNVKTWIGFGGMMDNPRALAPWRCEFGTRVRCRLRTSFGGTKPTRTYRLRFRIKSV